MIRCDAIVYMRIVDLEAACYKVDQASKSKKDAMHGH